MISDLGYFHERSAEMRGGGVANLKKEEEGNISNLRFWKFEPKLFHF